MHWHGNAAAGIAMALSLLAALPAASAEAPIRIGSPYATSTLDPMRSAAAGNIETFGQLYSRLLRRGADGALEPGLAVSWDISADGTVVTLKLRDANFSDGSPISAADVAFSLLRVRDDAESAYAAPLQQLKEARAEGDKTVVLTLKHPFAPFLGNLEVFNAGIVSKADVEKRGKDAFTKDPVTSGPYMVGEWRPNDRLILKPNPNYWRVGYPKNAGAELIEVPDANTRVSMMLSGELDAARDIPWSRVSEIQAREGLTLPLEPSTVIYMTLLNEMKPPFDDIKVRQAAAHALDAPAIAKAMTLGHAKRATTTLPAVDYHAADYPGIDYDPAKAKALLAESNYKGEELVILASSSGDNDKLSVLIQAQWTAVGIKSKIEKVDRGVWWERIPAGDYHASASWWYNETLDPDLAVRWALCGSCGSKSFYTGYNNKHVDEMTEAAARELDKAKRAELYREIQATTTTEVSQIPLFYAPYANAYSDRIKGLGMNPMLQWSLEETTVAGE
ncbi:peptide ABC transporter substrate-binding protein [Ensifer adhaerens]|uniref:Peptide ABC transporter substrate-binding protein n=1 Tax=Ensifer adhaerens TaxID=106592 RepID=A0A0L8BY26_ENSAD|nr:ABC transporter substrate-binding protein [Ensifer adhaerens]KOF19488.1 peptide ABC transporter substrate-binding protein [Ensifer adhaerens]